MGNPSQLSSQPISNIVWMALRPGSVAVASRRGGANDRFRTGRYAPSVCCVMLLPLLLTPQVGSSSLSVASPTERDRLSFGRLLTSGRRQTSGVQKVYEPATMHCRSDPFVLCRQICLTSVNAASAAAVVSVTVSSRLAPGCLGVDFLFCWLSGWRTFRCAASSILAAGTKSVLVVWWRCCGCYSAPQYH